MLPNRRFSFIFLLWTATNALRPTSCRSPRQIRSVPSAATASGRFAGKWPRQTPTARFTATTANLDAAKNDDGSSDGGSSVAAATFSLIKAIVGSGCLALPAGVAAVSNYPSALIPANVLMVVLGTMSAYTFTLYGRLTHATQANSLGDLWKKIYKSESSTIVSLANFVYCFGCCLTFNLIIGDMFSSLATAGGLSGLWASRQAAILAVTATTLVPLCNLQSLASLAPVSIIGVLGTVVSTLFLAWRCPAIVPSSPYAKVGKGMLASIPTAMQPQFKSYSRLQTPAPLILIAMTCVSFMAHFSAPDFYRSLAGKNVDQRKTEKTMAKFNTMTVAGYVVVGTINALTLTFGFLTFGGNSAGVVLNNYANADIGASVSRLLVAISVIGGFPFLFSACRSAALDLFAKKGQTVTRATETRYTSVLLAILTAIALVIKDAGFVVSFNGALMGTALIYIFPTLLFLKQSAGSTTKSTRLSLERALCKFLVGFGVVSSLIGGATSVMNSYFPHLLR